MAPDGRRVSTQRSLNGVRMLLWGVALVLCGGPVFGMQREIQTKVANYDEAPVVLRRASLKLVETYSTPSQFPLATSPGGQEVRIERSRVRYLNRMNQEVPTYLLEGDLELQNDTRREIAAVQISTVFFNAFRERLETGRHSVTESFAPYQTKHIRWSKSLPHQEVFEVYFVLTAVRFSDGTVWAPTEELVVLP